MDLNQINSFCSIELTTNSDLDEIYHDEIEGDNDFFEFQLIFDINRSQRSITWHLPRPPLKLKRLLTITYKLEVFRTKKNTIYCIIRK